MKLLTTNYQLPTTNKGVSLYLALVIMFILIAISLGVSLIIVSQMKMIKGMGDSVVAFYAADTGIEHAMYDRRKDGGTGAVNGTLNISGETAFYNVISYLPSENRWDSKCSFRGVSRAIEITQPAVFDFYLAVYEDINNTPEDYSDDKEVQFGYWCTPESITPGLLTLRSFLLSPPDQKINFKYSAEPPGVVITFDPTDYCLLTNGCISKLYFDFSSVEEYSATITFEGITDIKSKTLDFRIYRQISGSCVNPFYP
jgi:hypothetical protein